MELSNNALQPIAGAVTVGTSSRPWVLAPPSAERERYADMRPFDEY